VTAAREATRLNGEPSSSAALVTRPVGRFYLSKIQKASNGERLEDEGGEIVREREIEGEEKRERKREREKGR